MNMKKSNAATGGNGADYTTTAMPPSTASRTTATPERAEVRVACWRKGIAKALAQYKRSPAYGSMIVPFDLIEDIEGRDIADVILDHLQAERGLTDEPTDASKARLVEQGEVAAFEAVVNTTRLRGDELAVFVRRFFRKGDVGLRDAMTRALKVAITA